MSDIKMGYVVRLKSGGPKMTVNRVYPGSEEGSEYATCLWFEGESDLKKSEFKTTSLEVVD